MGDRHYVMTGAAGFGFGAAPRAYRTTGSAQSDTIGGLLLSPVLGDGRLGLVAPAPF